MMRTLLVFFVLLSLSSSAALAADDQAIKDRVDQFQAAWNKDDAKAMAAIWTEDGTLINPFNATAKGRDEIEKIFVDEHTHAFKGSTYTASDVKVQWVTPDVALVDLSGNISGVHGPDGAAAPDFPHHVTWVLIKKDGQWMAAAARAFQFSARPGESK
jgi:uncharacterized protein (TIGR02246 family)